MSDQYRRSSTMASCSSPRSIHKILVDCQLFRPAAPEPALSAVEGFASFVWTLTWALHRTSVLRGVAPSGSRSSRIGWKSRPLGRRQRNKKGMGL